MNLFLQTAFFFLLGYGQQMYHDFKHPVMLKNASEFAAGEVCAQSVCFLKCDVIIKVFVQFVVLRSQPTE